MGIKKRSSGVLRRNHGLGFCRPVLSAAFVLFPLYATAQVAPNAGSLQRQLRDGAPELPSQQQPAAPAVPDAAGDDTQTLLVSGFILDGATLIPADELQAVLADRVGREQSLRDLQVAAQAVADSYRRRGYFARAFIPAQNIQNGVVHIQVVEGRFGSMQRRAQPSRADGDYVAKVVGTGLVPGQPYSMDGLERGLLLANDLPGIRADGTLAAGQDHGTSDLILDVQDRPLLSAGLGASNSGSRSTGEYVGAATASLNSALGGGDQVSVLGMKSERLSYGQMSASVPLGHDGWRAGLSASALTYRLGREFRDLQAHGTALTQGGEISYPLIRSSAENLRTRAFYEHATYDDDALGDALHRKAVNRGGLALSGDKSDGWGGGGLTSYAVVMSGGNLDMSDLPVDEAQDKAGAKTSGTFAKLTLDARRDQRLTDSLFLRGRVAGQWSNQNLDSSEQFSLGGPQGVRAYPVSEGLGDRGVLTNVELHHSLTQDWAKGLDLFAFADAGLTGQHAHPWAGWRNGADVDNTYALFGAGLGINYTLEQDLGATLVAAVPLGANQGTAAWERNQDGSRQSPRFWFTLTKIF